MKDQDDNMFDIPNNIAQCLMCGGQIILPLANQSNYYACQKCKTINGPYRVSGEIKIFTFPKENLDERH